MIPDLIPLETPVVATPAAAAGGHFDVAGPLGRSLAAAGSVAGPAWLVQLAFTAVVWLLIAALLAMGLRLMRRVSIRSSNEIDDILYARLQRPLWTALTLIAAADLVDVLVAPPAMGGLGSVWPPAVWMVRAVEVAAVVALTWLASTLVENGLLRGIAALAGRTTTRIDDQLTPLLRTLVRPMVWVLGAIVVLELLGVSVRSLALVVGGTSFVLAFALKESLEDVFSGLMLFVDQPFEPNDVLALEDGSICEVQRTLIRTTRLYDASRHTIVVVPNRKLATQKLTNLSRPSPDMKLVISLAVAAHANHEAVAERLKAAADGHPWVLGDRSAKLLAMRSRLHRLAWHGQHAELLPLLREEGRVAVEGEMRAAVADLSKHVLTLSSQAHSREKNGFDEKERRRTDTELAAVDSSVEAVQRALAAWLLGIRLTYVAGNRMGLDDNAMSRLGAEIEHLRAGRTVATAEDMVRVGEAVDRHLAPAMDYVREYQDFVRDKVDEAMKGSFGAALILLPREIDDVQQALYLAEGQERLFEHSRFGGGLADADTEDGGIPDLDAVSEYVRRYVEWSRKARQLTARVNELSKEYHSDGGRRLDEMLLALHKWLAFDFMEEGPTWKYPSVAISGFENGRQYELKCFVDDVRLAHYTRPAKVAEHLRLDIYRLLAQHAPTVSLGGPVLTATVRQSVEP